ncbi:MAG: hypothetical protein JWO81_3423, partial [Alphaproteobacteria bacterium]|nr:hypothetical protein [Alphaproteobacteria bacterium]
MVGRDAFCLVSLSVKPSHLGGAAAVALLLAGCGSRGGGGGNVADNEAAAVGAEANAMLANLGAPSGQDDAARIRDLIARAMPAAMPDAKDAQYRNLRSGVGGAVCGEVAAKTAGRAAPAFRPFVINPDGFAVVAATPKLAYDDPGDFVADAWIRWCASPEELQKLAPQLHRAASDPASAPINGVDAAADAAPPP